MNSMKYPNPFFTAHVAGIILLALLGSTGQILISLLLYNYLYPIAIFFCFVYVLAILMAALALRRISQPSWYALSGFVVALAPLALYAFTGRDALPRPSSPACFSQSGTFRQAFG